VLPLRRVSGRVVAQHSRPDHLGRFFTQGQSRKDRVGPPIYPDPDCGTRASGYIRMRCSSRRAARKSDNADDDSGYRSHSISGR
jgi:hypothetical protein